LTLEFIVIVSDSEGLQDTDQVSITINDNGFGGFSEDVLTVRSATETPIGITVENGVLVSLEAIDGEDCTEDLAHMPDDLPYGLFDMQIKTDNAGGEAIVTFFLPEPADFGAKWYKYSSGQGWSDFSDHVAFNEAREQVILTLTDGGEGDLDGEKNGVIVADDTPESLAASVSRAHVQLVSIDHLPQLITFAKDNNIEYEAQGRHISIIIDEQKISELLESLAKNNLHYSQISIAKPTLEDYFLAVARKGSV